ncbi:hypothetical protein [Deferrisoma sp.]
MARRASTRPPKIRAPLPVMMRLRGLAPEVARFVTEVGESVEAVPCGNGVCALVGSPPDEFRIVWIDAGGRRCLDDEVPAERLEEIRARIREAYFHTPWDVRYLSEAGKRTFLVAVSDELAQAVREACSAALA